MRIYQGDIKGSLQGDKIGSFGLWSRVIVLPFCQNDSPIGDPAPRPQRSCFINPNQHIRKVLAKGQLKSEWIYEVIVCSKMPTKNFPDFCPTKETRIVAKKTALHSSKNHQKNATVLVCLIGQKSGNILVGFLGETVTS